MIGQTNTTPRVECVSSPDDMMHHLKHVPSLRDTSSTIERGTVPVIRRKDREEERKKRRASGELAHM